MAMVNSKTAAALNSHFSEAGMTLWWAKSNSHINWSRRVSDCLRAAAARSARNWRLKVRSSSQRCAHCGHCRRCS
jgi:hypothetical protein